MGDGENRGATENRAVLCLDGHSNQRMSGDPIRWWEDGGEKYVFRPFAT